MSRIGYSGYMQTKNTTALFSIIFLLAGIGIGMFFARNTAPGDATMDHAMTSMTASLDGKDGDAFDKAFIDEMIVHHQGAVAMAELALMHAGHKEIKTLAKAIIAAQTTEITQMQGWRASWYANQ